MKVVGLIGKWEWLVGEDGTSYKRYVGTSRLIVWPLPDSLALGSSVKEDVSAIVVDFKPEVKSVVEDIVNESHSVSLRMERYRRAKAGLSRASGRPRGDGLGLDVVERVEGLLGKGMSLSSACRCVGISRGQWYGYKRGLGG